MYTDFYGLQEKPFSLTASTRYLYLSESHQNAFTMLKYGVMQRSGIVLMTGDTGTGKTLLLNHMLSQQDLMASTEIVLVMNPFAIGDDLTQYLAEELGVAETAPATRAGKLKAIEKHLLQRRRERRHVLLVIDEAQSLSDRILDELRMLNNMQMDQDILLQVLLVGQSELRTRIKSPAMRPLAQRISVASHIDPMTAQETRNYVNHRLQVAGRKKKDLFNVEAIRAIYKHVGGIPREINQLCDTAMTYGFAEEAATIDHNVLAEVIQDRNDTGIVTNGSSQPRDDVAAENLEALTGRMAQMEGTMKKLQRVVVQHIKEVRS